MWCSMLGTAAANRRGFMRLRRNPKNPIMSDPQPPHANDPTSISSLYTFLNVTPASYDEIRRELQTKAILQDIYHSMISPVRPTITTGWTSLAVYILHAKLPIFQPSNYNVSRVSVWTLSVRINRSGWGGEAKFAIDFCDVPPNAAEIGWSV